MILQLYILRQLLMSFFFSMAGIWLIVLPTIAIQAIHKLGAVSVAALIQYLPLVVVELVPYLTPMAFMLAVVGTYGRIASDRELVAIRMAGIHPARIMLPGLGLALVLVVSTAYMQTTVSPEWKYIQANFILQTKREAFEKFGQGLTEIEFGDCYLSAERRYGNEFHGVMLGLTDEDGERMTVTANVAGLEIRENMLHISLHEADVFREGIHFNIETLFWSRSLDDLFPFVAKERTRAKYLTSDELREEIAAERFDERILREFAFEIHRRGALSAIYLLFLLMGIPTGIKLQSGTQLAAFTGAAGYAILYYVVALRLGEELARTGFVPEWTSAWATNFLFLIVGSTLTYRVLWR